MRIIAKKTLRQFWEANPAARSQLEAWFSEAKSADWKSPADVKEKYRSASILQGGRVVFNIKGNDYRLVAKINYEYRVIYIRFVGTHEEYDAIDANEV